VSFPPGSKNPVSAVSVVIAVVSRSPNSTSKLLAAEDWPAAPTGTAGLRDDETSADGAAAAAAAATVAFSVLFSIGDGVLCTYLTL